MQPLTPKQRDAIMLGVESNCVFGNLDYDEFENWLNENTAEYGKAAHYFRRCDCESCETIRRGWNQENAEREGRSLSEVWRY